VKGTEEIITVFEGELLISIGEIDYFLKKNDTIRFNANKSHVYENRGLKLTKLNLILHYE